MIPVKAHMEHAIEAAREARRNGDYAVGCAIILGGEVLATGGNRTHVDRDPTLHAEMIAIRSAASALDAKNLSDCVLYATHEPCPMCMGAIIWARITTVVFGASMTDHIQFRDRHANDQWKWRVIDIPAEHIARQGDPLVELIPGFMQEECCGLFHK